MYEDNLKVFVTEMKRRNDEDYATNYSNLVPPTFEIENGGKYIRIVRKDQGASGGSMECFIAKSTFSNKTMGNVKEGDIFKAASYKVPAKHARGNIFNPDNGFSAFGRGGSIRYMS